MRNTILAYTALVSVLTASALVAFNHQKSSSSITHSTLYAVRRDPIALEALGDNITYRDYWPWISGKINQIKGDIDFSYAVKGDKDQGSLHFKCIRKHKNSQDWFIIDWSLNMPDGRSLSLTRDEPV